jgi:uncharacterized protein (DUF2235 family)
MDGTSNRFSDKNTNIVKLFSALKIADDVQLAYYDSGVGVRARDHRFGVIRKVLGYLQTLGDYAFGW